MEIIKKLALCKSEIKTTKMKKEGKNTFSNYEYFTPSQIEKLVFDACEKHKLITKFDLIRNEYGITGKLTLIDTENYETNNLMPVSQELVFEMATAIPEIKATNIAQQLGGCVTYTERYLKMSAFGITDNSLDFDDNRVVDKEVSIQDMRKLISDKCSKNQAIEKNICKNFSISKLSELKEDDVKITYAKLK